MQEMTEGSLLLTGVNRQTETFSMALVADRKSPTTRQATTRSWTLSQINQMKKQCAPLLPPFFSIDPSFV